MTFSGSEGMDLKSTTGKLIRGDIKGVAKDLSGTLERSLSLVGVIIISLASMVGSGLFVLPGFAAAIMGPGIWFAYLLAALVVLPGAISKAEISSAIPKTGGTYVYLERAYGPWFGTISGLGLWASFLLKSAFALIGFSAYLHAVSYFFEISINTTTVALYALVLITGLNILGVKKIKNVQTPILVVTMIAVCLIAVYALFLDTTDFGRPWQGATDASFTDIASASAFVFVAYAGVIKVTAIGGEVKQPERNLPSSILVSLVIATLLYCVLTYIMMAAVPGEWWFNADGSTNEAPIYVFVHSILSNEIAVIIATLAVLTMISGALAGLLASSRFLFAMARDNLLPTALENVNVKYETPHWPIIITGLLMAVAILLLPVEDVAKLASGFQIMVYILMCGTVFIFRRANKVHGNYLPTFNSPLYPLMQFWGILAGLYLLYIMGSKGILGAGIAIIVGTFTYFAYGKKHSIDRVTPFQTFRTLFANPTPTEHELRVKVFHAADMGEKNHLNYQEFRHAMKTLNFEFTNDELRRIFHLADDDDDGVIDIDDFINAYEAALEEQ